MDKQTGEHPFMDYYLATKGTHYWENQDGSQGHQTEFKKPISEVTYSMISLHDVCKATAL